MIPLSISVPIHTVKNGECITSISDHYGLFWESVWSHANNEELRASRSDPHTLAPGDRLFVPERVVKEVSCETSKRHSFRRRGIPAVLRLQLFARMKPRKNAPFVLDLDTGDRIEGQTDGEGFLRVPVPTRAGRGTLRIGDDEPPLEILIGALAPIESVEGVQARLRNLGFYAGKTDGEPSPQLTRALRLYQLAYGLEITGERDDATVRSLRDMHDRGDQDPGEISIP